jgi:hypothetical protein
VFDFEISEEDMEFIKKLGEARPKKVMNFDNIQNSFNLPDGYKLKLIKI